MRRLLALAIVLAAPPAYAQTKNDDAVDTPFILHNYLHTFFGMSKSPNVSTPMMLTTFEIGRHPFRAYRGNETYDGRKLNEARTITFGAFSAGGVVASGYDPAGKLFYLSLGLRFAVDLTYVFLSGLWSTVDFDQCFPFHVTLGERLTLAYTNSWNIYPAYELVRVEAETALDLEFPFGARKQHSLIFRTAIDSSVALDTTFRFVGQIGYGFSWERP